MAHFLSGLLNSVEEAIPALKIVGTVTSVLVGMASVPGIVIGSAMAGVVSGIVSVTAALVSKDAAKKAEEAAKKAEEAAKKAEEAAKKAAAAENATAEEMAAWKAEMLEAEARLDEAVKVEAEAWKAMMLEAKAGLDAALKAEEEAFKEAEKAAGQGAKIGGELIERIEAGLEAALGVLKAKTGDLLVESENLLQSGVPTLYGKVLAGLLMTLDAMGIKLLHIALDFMRLSGSEVGKKVAKEAKDIVEELHEKVDKLTEDSLSLVLTHKESHDTLMEKMSQHVDSTKREIEKLKDNLEELARMENDVELKGGEEKK